MHRLLWQCFGDWLQQRGQRANYVFLIEAIHGVRKEFTVEKFNALLSQQDFLKVLALYWQFFVLIQKPLLIITNKVQGTRQAYIKDMQKHYRKQQLQNALQNAYLQTKDVYKN